MRTYLIVALHVRQQDVTKMSFAEHDDMIDALRRQPHRNVRSAAQPGPAPPIARCSTCAGRRKNRRDSNRRWMKVQWQVNGGHTGYFRSRCGSQQRVIFRTELCGWAVFKSADVAPRT